MELFNFRKIRYSILSFKILTFLVFFAVNINAQINEFVSSVEVNRAVEREPVRIRLNLIQTVNISNITIAYRVFGESEFSEQEMELTGLSASAIIPSGDVKLPLIEYFFTITLTNGSFRTYPDGIFSGTNPIQIVVNESENVESDILILSPEEGETITEESLLITVSLLRTSSRVNYASTKLFIDDENISSMAIFAEDLLIFRAANFPGTVDDGIHSLRVETYDMNGDKVGEIVSSFNLKSDRLWTSSQSLFTYNVELKSESRNERFNDDSKWFNNISGQFIGNYDEWKFRGKLLVTSEEKKYLQPQNRYSASVSSHWLNLDFGDSYPQYSKLVLNGKRVRGVSGGVYLGAFNLEASYGQLDRAVDGELLEPIATADTVAQDIIEIDSVMYGTKLGRVKFGKFNRGLFLLRPSFGSGNNFQFGLTYLHSKDDKNSAEFGPQPKENLLFGTDLFASADSRRVVLKAEAAVNLTNEDISTGTLSDAEIDSIFGDDGLFSSDPETIKKIKNSLGRFITVNQFLNPLNPQKFASFAGEVSLELNYLYNSLTASYIYRGNEFRSFGQNYLRTDVKGFSLIDRIRIIQNKVYISLSYEHLEDNLQETKLATTTFNTVNASVSLYPRTDLPNITIGFSRYDNNNDLSSSDSQFSLYQIDEATNKFLMQFSYDIGKEIRHNLYLNISASDKEDYTQTTPTGLNVSASFMINSNWSPKFTSYVNLVNFSSKYAAVPYNYSTISIGGKYKAMPEKLEFSFNVSPSFGDFKRQSLDLIAYYYAIENLWFVLQSRIFRIPDSATNSVIGLTAQWNIQ